ncbi:DUF4864 domain-containing protein [Cognatishimia activa]|uniref:DUF4864 domain-containing protein n=1 Tax=Cognatishimia activa TaxID=1715691 RepID=UPI0022304F70|nr:DUF4864 domain-containing protein [Cognatishimia activa]UZD89999.1 DUF4864 domain-containing protein [Cognatishimia activa]
MRQILAVLLIVLGSASFAQEEDIQSTITSQIEAFGEDDFETAFSYASPSIQMLFGNPQRFEMMVRNGYPMVINPSELTYLPLEDREGLYLQQVQIRDQDGVLYRLEYQMLQTNDVWRINGVRFLPLDPAV